MLPEAHFVHLIRDGRDVALSFRGLWFGPGDDTEGGDDDPTPPRLLAKALTVAEVDRPEGTFTVGAATTVHVLVPTDDLAEVLAATTSNGTVSVVLVPGTGGSS